MILSILLKDYHNKQNNLGDATWSLDFFFFNLSLRKDDHTYLALRIRYRKCHQPFLSLRGSIDQSVITTGASQLNGNMILTAFKAVRFDPIANKKPMHIFLELFDLLPPSSFRIWEPSLFVQKEKCNKHDLSECLFCLPVTLKCQPVFS